MIVKHDYAAILANLSQQFPLNLDDAVFDPSSTAETVDLSASPSTPSPMLWQSAEASVSRLGIRVREPIQNPVSLATRFASIAVERQVYPVFLSYIGDCGMQRFGFRTEQLSGLTQETQQQFEEQLALFWKLALIIEVSEIEHLR